MQLRKIITTRRYNSWVSWDLVFEWENIMSKVLHIPFFYEKRIMYNKYVAQIPVLSQIMQTSEYAFRFDMNPNRKSDVNNKKNIIPCIIDFFLKDKEELAKFYQRYSKNRIVFVSSSEVYQFLESNNCPLNVRHLALSISDKYKIEPTTKFEKKYDLVMMGRQNPVLKKFVEQYAKDHPNFRYVFRIKKDGSFTYYTSDGYLLGDMNSRKKYMELMRQARVGLYSTPGIDGGETLTNGFNQVTPRFLELVACGCHIIARYPNNPDTEYYELSRFSPNIEDYFRFEKEMDKCLSTEVNMDKYATYLSKHYTSVRCKELQQALIDL